MKFAIKITSTVLAFALIGSALGPMDVLTQTASAQAMSSKSIVDTAKAQGLVGENISGYLELVSASAPANVKAAVNDINIRRRSIYTAHARRTGESISDVAGVSGEKLVAKAKPGEKIKVSNGVWVTR